MEARPGSPDWQQRVREIPDLASPPAVTARLIELCHDDEAGIGDVVDVLGTDAALAARLMRLANSSLYARRQPTENLRQVVTFLGFDAVLSASLSLTLANLSRSGGRPSSPLIDRIRTRSVLASAAAQVLARDIPDVEDADAALVALLQDIGVQVIDALEPDTYVGLDPQARHADLERVELERIGADHATVGAWMLEAWGLPDRIVDGVRSSHGSTPDGSVTVLAASAIAGAEMADVVGGDIDALDRAREIVVDELRLASDAHHRCLDSLASTARDLASIFDAAVPDHDVLTVKATEAIVACQLRASVRFDELNEAIEQLRSATDELQSHMFSDPLTGLWNRRRLDQLVDAEIQLAAQYGDPLSILFVELDDFKLTNDRLGHRAGDTILIESSRRLRNGVREGDHVGRFGGEEFVVVLPGADGDAATRMAERLVSLFDAEPITVHGVVELVQTVSVGSATCTRSDGFLPAPADLIEAADRALHRARNTNEIRRVRHEAAVI